MEEKILTDEQINLISKTLEEGRTEQSKMLKDLVEESEKYEENPYKGISENTEDKPFPYHAINREVTVEEAYIQVDPKTGEEVQLVGYESNSKSLTEEIFDEQTVSIKGGEETLKSYGLSDEDSIKLFDVITRFRAGEKFNVYHELPQPIAEMVKQLNGPNMATINRTAKDMLNHFIREMSIDNEFIDLQQSIQKELNLLNISEMYNDELRVNMEVNLIKKAEELESQGELEKANILKEVSKAFTDSYNFTTILDALNNNDLIRRKIRKDESRYKRFVNDFNYKYLDSKFKISNIKLIEQVLPSIMEKDNITESDIRKFIIVICKATEHMDSNDVIQHTFMYYTIQNILLLKYIDIENSSFGKEVYNNLLNAIKLMKEVELNECNRS